jgi:hypothetical protein
VLDDAVATEDTVTQLIGAIRRVGREVSGAEALIDSCCTGHDYRQPGKPPIAWDDAEARPLFRQFRAALLYLRDANRPLQQQVQLRRDRRKEG